MATKREICEYYGQDYDNIKHLKWFVESLVQRYKDETRTQLKN